MQCIKVLAIGSEMQASPTTSLSWCTPNAAKAAVPAASRVTAARARSMQPTSSWQYRMRRYEPACSQPAKPWHDHDIFGRLASTGLASSPALPKRVTTLSSILLLA